MTHLETEKDLPQNPKEKALAVLKSFTQQGIIVKQPEVHKTDPTSLRPSRDVINIAPPSPIRIPYELSQIATNIAQALDGNVTNLSAQTAQKGDVNTPNDPLTDGILLPQIRLLSVHKLEPGATTNLTKTAGELIINVYPSTSLADYARRHQAGLTGEDGVGHQPHHTIIRMSGNAGWERGFLPNTAWADLSLTPPPELQ